MTYSLPILIAVAAVAGIVGWLLARSRSSERNSDQRATQTAELAAKQARLNEWAQTYSELQAEVASLRAQLMQRGAELAASQASLEATRSQSEEKLALLQSARQELSDQFRALAAEIMDEKSKKFVELNQASVTQLLTPLQEALTGFRQKVEEVYVNESKDRSALGEKLKILTELNGTLREETNSLTKALKGDAKAQGNWGEVILDRLLESAGLMEGEHYKTQESHRDDEGDRVIPDVVLYLPNERQMVVDSKVTLTAYSEFASATTDEAREAALKAHLEAMRRHVKGLSEKNYQNLYALKSPDFVVLFMPLEGAFMAAVTRDADLFQYAWKRNVLLVSPSTLLFVVRTIAHMWRQEEQKRNVQEIARRGAALYDKFVGFASGLGKVGDHLTRARESYDEARKKLSEGSGNLVRQAEMLRNLGVRPTKTMPADLAASLDEEMDDEDVIGLLPPG
jgi:DNA recombination protein RmuC